MTPDNRVALMQAYSLIASMLDNDREGFRAQLEAIEDPWSVAVALAVTLCDSIPDDERAEVAQAMRRHIAELA